MYVWVSFPLDFMSVNQTFAAVKTVDANIHK